MKTIVIIEDEKTESKPLTRLFQQWQQKTNLLTVYKEGEAVNILSKHQVDLVIYDLTIPGNSGLDGLSNLCRGFPYIPCIAITDRQKIEHDKALDRGAGYCFKKPLDNDDFLRHVKELLNTGTRGTVKGIPIHSFLQMLESEEKTCTLQVNRKNDRGMLYLKNGVLVSAETKSLVGEEAAFLILTWEETIVEIRYFNGQRKHDIQKPLITIILEAFRLRSERDKLRKLAASEAQHQLPLKHLSTRESSISLNNGDELRIEVPHMQTPLESTVVGIYEEQFLIITTPSSFSLMEKMISSERRIIVKYIQEGKIWMFKSQLLKAIDSPAALIFLEYPEVIHYHELRKNKRTAIFVPSTFHQQAQPELYGTLIDLSTSGGLCRIKNRPEAPPLHIDIDSRIQLRCLLPGTKEEQKIDATVRNLKKDSSSTRIGVEFENLQPHLIEIISKYLYSVEESV